MLDYDRLTYAESAAIARNSILFPERTPDAAVIEKLHSLAAYCTKFYEPLPGDADLVGLFLFRQRNQAGEGKNTLGLCYVDDFGKAVIGMSVEALRSEPLELCRYIFLHEMAHLTDTAHNDAFTMRLNGFMVLYFNRDTRMDSKAKFRKAAGMRLF